MVQFPGRPSRLRIFLYPGVEEDLTPEQYQDGSDFFAEAQENLWCANCVGLSALGEPATLRSP